MKKVMDCQGEFSIQIRNLYKGYYGMAQGSDSRGQRVKINVLENVNFDVREKEFVSILGKSGSGKTTMLHLIAGFLKPDKGEILVLGKRKAGPDKEIGVIFQDYVLFPWYTVYENVAFGLKVAKKSRQEIEKITMDCLRHMELEAYKDYYPCQLSGGMKQRTAIARALVNSPKVIIMDEPLSAQDKITKEGLYRLLKQYGEKQGTTFLMVTHSIEEAVRLADRVLVVNDKTIALNVKIELESTRNENNPDFVRYINLLHSAI
ncbi:MAG: ABC transporter ATP-binding protein [Acetatifactor sp.]